MPCRPERARLLTYIVAKRFIVARRFRLDRSERVKTITDSSIRSGHKNNGRTQWTRRRDVIGRDESNGPISLGMTFGNNGNWN